MTVEKQPTLSACSSEEPHHRHKIGVYRHSNGQYTFKSFNGPNERGTIIDFVQERHGYTSLGEVRKHLRSHSGLDTPGLRDDRPQRAILSAGFDRSAIIKRYAAMPGVTYEGGHAYLQRRGLGVDVIAHPLFKNRIKTGPMGEAIFPHYDKEGLCGYEKKNRGYTGFAEGGAKGLWASNSPKPHNEKLFIGESAIDCMSHFAITRDDKTRYLSTAGSWNDKTADLIKAAVANHPGKIVVLGYDADDAGRTYEKTTREILKDSGKEIITQWPARGKDWNDQLTGRDSRIEKAEAKQQEQPAAAPPAPASPPAQSDNTRSPEAKTDDAAKTYLKEMRARRPAPPARAPDQDKKKDRGFSQCFSYRYS